MHVDLLVSSLLPTIKKSLNLSLCVPSYSEFGRRQPSQNSPSQDDDAEFVDENRKASLGFHAASPGKLDDRSSNVDISEAESDAVPESPVEKRSVQIEETEVVKDVEVKEAEKEEVRLSEIEETGVKFAEPENNNKEVSEPEEKGVKFAEPDETKVDVAEIPEVQATDSSDKSPPVTINITGLRDLGSYSMKESDSGLTPVASSELGGDSLPTRSLLVDSDGENVNASPAPSFILAKDGDRKLNRVDTQRAMEATVLAQRVECLQKLQEQNEACYLALSNSVEYDFNDKELTDSRMAYNRTLIDLEKSQRIWEFNQDPFEELREAVTLRENLINSMKSTTMEYQKTKTMYEQGTTADSRSPSIKEYTSDLKEYKSDVSEASLNMPVKRPLWEGKTKSTILFEEKHGRMKTTDEIAVSYKRKLEDLQALNTRITTLEIQVESEQAANKELYAWFDGKMKVDNEEEEDYEASCDCYTKSIKKVAEYNEGLEAADAEELLTSEGEKMDVDKFEDFWMTHFGVQLDKRKLKFYISQRNHNTMRTYAKSCSIAYADRDDLDEHNFNFDDFENFWHYPDIEKLFHNVSRPDLHDEQSIDRSLFKGFLRYVYGVQPEEAIYLIRDNRVMSNAQKKEETQFTMHALFVVICGLLLMTVLYTLGGQDRYLQNQGVKQILLDTMWNDKTFYHINSIGTFYEYMSLVLLPYVYAGLEWCTFSDVCEGPELSNVTMRSFEVNRQYEYASAMNPYVIGGFRIRTIRSQLSACDSDLMRRGGSKKVQDIYPFTDRCAAIDSGDMFEGVWERFTVNGTGLPYDKNDRSTWFDPHIPQEGPLQKLNEVYKFRSREYLDEAKFDRGSLVASYPGDGYIADFPPLDLSTNGMKSCQSYHANDPRNLAFCLKAGCGPNEPLAKCEARYMLESLRKNNFIDGQTRAVLVDMYLFNPTMRFHTFVRLAFETRIGTFYPDNEIETWNLMVYAGDGNTGPIMALTLFMIFSVIFTGYHLKQFFTALNLLGYPICCFCCYHRRRSNRMAKMSDSTRRWVVENRQMVQFLKYIPKSERQKKDANAGLLLIPIENITHHRIKQKEYSLIKSLNQVLRSQGRQAEQIQIENILITEHGGCTVVFEIDADTLFKDLSKETRGCPCFAEVSQKEKTYMQIGSDLEELISTYMNQSVNILVDTRASWVETIVGHGALTFYNDFWNALDTIVVLLIWFWFLIHMSVYPSIKADDYIDPLVFSSMRFMRLSILFESTVLFLLSWVAVIKTSQWLVSLNDTIKQFYNMIRDIIGIIASYGMVVVLWCATFGMMGYVIFATQLYEFRYYWEVILTMVRHIVTPMDAKELGEATIGFQGNAYHFCQTLFMSLILVNIFLAIILKAWDDVSDEMSNKRRSKNWFPQFNRFLGIGVKGELHDPKDDWLEQEDEWRRVYPAGCPNRRLKHYLVNQLEIDDEDAELLMEFVDTDRSGTVSWSELETLLKHFKPNIDNKNFAMRRRHTNEMTTFASSLGQKFKTFKGHRQDAQKQLSIKLDEIFSQLQTFQKQKSRS